jgi:peroxiredoxin
MSSSKIVAGSHFPEVFAISLSGKEQEIGQPSQADKWRLVVVYRGKHCPMCTRYLKSLEMFIPRLSEGNFEVVAVSADSEDQLNAHMEKLDISFPIYHGLSIEKMQELGLYISIPRSEKETDHLFPEPGLFVINNEGNVQVVDVSNNPFVRPDLETLLNGLEFIRNPDNNYPIRGTYSSD